MLGRSLLIALAVGAHALQLPTPRGASDAWLSRRRVLGCAPLVAVGAAAPLPAAAASDARKLDEIKVLTAKARSLRTYVRQTSYNRRSFPMDPAGGNYVNIANTVVRGYKEVLLPLQAAIIAKAAETSLADPEKKKLLDQQPELMKGHLSELEFYNRKGDKSFEKYVSKTTGDTYLGGKVERELEEVCDTASDFLLLLQGKSPPVRDD